MILVLVVVGLPAGLGTGLASAKVVDWGWALIGALLLSVFLASALGGSLMTEQELTAVLVDIGSDEWAFLSRWLGAIGLVCSPLLAAICLGVAIAIGAAVGDHYSSN